MATRFTDLVGCEHPIQCAAMSGIATAPLAAAVSNAGGLGMLGIGRRGPEQVEALLDELGDLTDRPVGGGFVHETMDPDSVALVAERLPVVEFFWGEPDPALAALDCIVGWQVGSVDEASAAVEAGCSYVVVQGVEAGGHIRGTTELVDLYAGVRRAVGDEPILVVGGGIGTGHDLQRALELGADAVRLGTRFAAAIESTAHDRYIEILAGASDDDTELSEAFWVGWPDATHRVLTSAVEASGEGDDVVGTFLTPRGDRRKVPRFFASPPTRDFDGDIDAMALYAGVGSTGAVTGRVPAATIIDELTRGLA